MTETKRGRFIVFEGIDGSGKTTQAKAIAEWLPTSGLLPEGKKVVLTREPGGTEIGQNIREMVLHGKAHLDPLTELLLFAADRAQHVATVIKPALERGDWVVCDRFTGSTMAYQGGGRGLDWSTVYQINRFSSHFSGSDFTKGVTPDLILLLDIEPKLAASRRSSGDRLENEKIEFTERVRKEYLNQSCIDQAWRIVWAECNESEVKNQCVKIIRSEANKLLGIAS